MILFSNEGQKFLKWTVQSPCAVPCHSLVNHSDIYKQLISYQFLPNQKIQFRFNSPILKGWHYFFSKPTLFWRQRILLKLFFESTINFLFQCYEFEKWVFEISLLSDRQLMLSLFFNSFRFLLTLKMTNNSFHLKPKLYFYPMISLPFLITYIFWRSFLNLSQRKQLQVAFQKKPRTYQRLTDYSRFFSRKISKPTR